MCVTQQMGFKRSFPEICFVIFKRNYHLLHEPVFQHLPCIDTLFLEPKTTRYSASETSGEPFHQASFTRFAEIA